MPGAEVAHHRARSAWAAFDPRVERAMPAFGLLGAGLPHVCDIRGAAGGGLVRAHGTQLRRGNVLGRPSGE
ncbi:MAG TPA: hypothetical protein VGB42_04505 [Candidatus Thermoplasmatota archaeon]